jgi:hypothetical protein
MPLQNIVWGNFSTNAGIASIPTFQTDSFTGLAPGQSFFGWPFLQRVFNNIEKNNDQYPYAIVGITHIETTDAHGTHVVFDVPLGDTGQWAPWVQQQNASRVDMTLTARLAFVEAMGVLYQWS